MKRLIALVALFGVGLISCTKSGTITPQPTTYTVVATSGPGGQISPSGTRQFNVGDAATFSLLNNAGYTLKSLKVNNVSVTPNYSKVGPPTYSMSTGGAIDAQWGILYHIKVISGANGTAAPQDTAVFAGDDAVINLNPNSDYHADSIWIGNKPGVSLDGLNQYTIKNVDSAYTVKVTFINGWTRQELARKNAILDSVGDWHYVKLAESLDSTGFFPINNVPISADVLVDDYEHYGSDYSYFSFVGASGGLHPYDFIGQYSLSTQAQLTYFNTGVTFTVTVYTISPTSLVVGYKKGGLYYWRYYLPGKP